MGEWVKATQEEAQAARLNKQRVRFTSKGWEVWSQDLTEEAEEVFKPMLYKDGKYVTNYQECDCGEQYLVESEHKKTSARHKKWAKGDQVEIEVPKQPLMSAYPLGIPTPKLEMGVNKVCERCKAKNKKGETFYPDPNSTPANRYPCRLCNGYGVRPNVG